MANFNWLENLPWIVFGLVLTIAVIIFLTGAFFFLAFRNPEKKQRGERILIRSIYWFSSAVLIIVVFFVLSQLLDKWQATPVENTGEIPFSPVSTSFPPPPESIEVAGVYFSGPFWLGNNTSLVKESIFLVLCKNDDQYDIIYIGENVKEMSLLNHLEYQCWTENCSDYSKLYLAVFEIPSVEQRHTIKTEALEALNKSFKPPCPYE